MTARPETTSAGQGTHLWRDTARPVAERVELLLAEMTLEEKVGQLGSRWVGNDMLTTGGAAGSPDNSAAGDVETLETVLQQLDRIAKQAREPAMA